MNPTPWVNDPALARTARSMREAFGQHTTGNHFVEEPQPASFWTAVAIAVALISLACVLL